MQSASSFLRRKLNVATWLVAAALCAVALPAQAEKVLNWGTGADVDSMDVHVAGTVNSWQMFEMVYETLLTTDKDMQLRPGLAESWKQTSPTTYVLTLRKDAQWSNGRPVVAADVIGTFERIKGMEMNPAGVASAKTEEEKKKASRKISSYWSRQLGSIKSMTATNDRAVQVELDRPQTAFLPALAHITAAIIPIKELKDGTYDPSRQLLGSGPFMVSAYKPKESWTLVKNPYYWRKGYPKVDTLNVVIIPDEAARVAALRDGRIDYSTFSNPDIAQLVANDKRIVVTSQGTTNYFRLDLNALSDNSAVKDKRVRQALSLAIDRDTIANIVFAGVTKPDYPVPLAFGKAACKDGDAYKLPRPARIEKAKMLLAAAGKPSVDLEMIASTADPIYARIAQVIQQSVKPAGFNVKIQQMPVAEYLNKVFTKGEFDTALSWLAGYSDPTMVIAWWNPKVAVWNTVFQEYVGPLADALDKVRGTPEGAQRDAELVDICRMIEDGSNILALVNKVDFIVHRADMMNIKLDPVSGSSNTYQYAAEFSSRR
jgi:peptide/nickel transport system substrate-binding protein